MRTKRFSIIATIAMLIVISGGVFAPAYADVIYVAGDVSGAWSADSVIVTDEVRVPPGATLTIEPGVEVLFFGYCKFIIDQATLIAVGTENDSIRFDEYSPGGNNWKGIRFLYASASSRLEYCHLTNGWASGGGVDNNGGAVYCDNSSPTIQSCLIDNCSADDKGGGIYCYESSPTISGNIISGNSADYYGGGIYCTDNSNPTISSNTISGNSAADNGSQGGGIYCNGSNPTISGNTISGNSTSGNFSYGGGIYCEGSSPTINNNTINGNSADYYGGGIYCSGSNPTINGNTINGNHGQKYGGGIYCTSSSPTIIGNTISDNSTGQYHGGGIYCKSDSDPTIRGNTINGNTTSDKGGGIYCDSNSNPIIASNIINGNIAATGGGIFCSSPPDTFELNEISGNTASGNGGGIFFSSPPAIFELNEISGNIASGNGGGIYLSNVNQTVNKNTIVNNSAASGGGLYCDNSSPPVINCILWGNSPEQMAQGAGSNTQITYSDIGQFWPGLGNINADPLFYSTTGDSAYYLTENSPCIDTGNPDPIYYDPDGTTADMGAYYFDQSGAPQNQLSGPLSGTLEAGEYHVVGDISVEQGQSLVIEPGVTMLFDADYHFYIYGYLSAAGTEADSIKFMPAAGNPFWGGLEFFDSASDNCVFEYCLFTGGRADGTYNVGGAMYISGCNPYIAHSTITGNTAQGSGGGIGLSISGAVIEYCEITGNSCENYYGGGIWMTSSWPIIRNCVINGNSTGNLCGGIHVEQSNTAQITNNIIAENQGSGVNLANSSAWVAYCDLHNNTGENFTGSTAGVYGVLSTVNANGDSCDVFSNIFLDPLFSTDPDSLYRLTENSPCIDAGDPASPLDPDGTVADMGAYYFWHEPNQLSGNLSGTIVAGEYYVVGDISIPSTDSLIIEPGAIFLFDGNFEFDINGYLYAVGNAIDSIKFMPNEVDSTWGGIDFNDSADDSSMLEYCFITGGHAAGSWPNDCGGGMCLNSSSPTISSCTISGNSAEYDGGGMYFYESSPTISSCTINGNSSYYGGGMSLISSSPTISSCTISGNSAEGNGGGMSLNASSPTISSCTISGNSCEGDGGGMRLYDSSPTILNTIVEGNTGFGGIYFWNSPDTSITYSDLYNNESGSFTGTLPTYLGQIVTTNTNGDSCDVFNNIFLDPLFSTDPDSLYRLTENSPCIDAGDPASPYDPDNTIADMGAFYFWHELELGLSGPLSGTIESGEYHVVGDISVATGESLTIEAGTTLLFDDYYSFTVNGFLHVAGTETDSVIFTAAEGNDSWAGITFSCDYQIENLVEYARISQSSASAPNPDGGAILIQPASHVTINNSTITGNHADGNGGGIAVAVGTLANVHLNYCLITGNSADSEGGGLFCNLGSEIFIDQCTISYNSCGVTGAGIRDHDSWLTVTNSVISHNTGGVGVFLSFNVTNISSFLYSDFYGHTEGNFGGWIPDGVEIITSTNANGDSCDVFNNIFLDPLFSAEPDSAYRLTEDSPCIDAGDPASPLDPDGTVADMGAYYFWHEDNTLTGPLSGTLTAGEYHVVGDISVEAGDSLVIEPGVTLLFEGHFELDINGLLTAVGTEADSITFMSAEVDVPWGGIDINDSSSDDSELGYCLITGSNSSGVHCDSSNVTINNSLITGNSSINHGGGVYCNAAGPTISNNTIDGNSALYWGSGIYCDNSNPDIFNNTITGNYVTDSLGKGGGICLQFNSNPNIDGNIITGNSAIFCGGGIYCQSSIPVINGNYISGNSSDYGGGIYCYLDCSSDITDNNINGNIAGLYGGGIYLHSNSDAVIERNIICNNSVTTYYGGGIHCGLSAPIISNNTISENSSAGLGGGMYFNNSSPTIFNVIVENNNGDGGISFRDSPTSTLTYSDIFNNVNGSFSGNTIPANLGAITTTNANGDSCDVFNNIFLDPLFSTNPDSLYRLTADSPCIDAGDPASPVDPDGTIADMGAYYFWHESNLILHVPSEYATIQAAIDASSDGDTVLVEDGIYTGNGNYYIDFGGRAIVVTSENGPENCIIDCENQGRGFNFQSGEDSVSVVSGFTITNGWVGHGGAFYILDNSSPKIDNCHIIDNSASGNGGGIRIEDSDPIIRNCLISGNSSTTMSCGGISCSSSNAAIENCIIEYNSGPSAGGGGFVSGQFSNPTVRNCTIRSNTANKGGGILVYAQSDINLENCAIDSNNASGADGDGGGIYVSVGCDAHIANCTLSGNTAQYQGGGICVYMGNLYLENSIITNSIGEGGIYFDNPYPATSIAYSDFNGNENGAFTGNVPADLGAISTTNVNGDPCDVFSNIFLDPLFNTNPDSAYRLTEDSPCIDAGDPAGLLDPDGTVADMGAYYFWHDSTATGPDTLWTRTYGGSEDDRGSCVRETWDGGYITTGSTYSYGAGNSDVYLIKTDSGGVEQWNQTFGGNGHDMGCSLQPTVDGGNIVAGYSNSFNAGDDGDFYLIKTDNEGNEIWSKTYGGSDYDEGYSVQQTYEGGYVLAGYTSSFGAGERDVWVIKTDEMGDSLWSNTFGGASDDEGQCILSTLDGGYIIVGKTESYGSGNLDVYLIKTDSFGNQEWSRTFGGELEDVGLGIDLTSDGGFIITGYTYSGSMGLNDVYFIKTDSNGDTLWTRTYGGSNYDEGHSVHQMPDGGYFITGGTLSFGAGSNDVYLIRTDANGDLLWSSTCGGTSYDLGISGELLIDGGFVIAGRTNSYGAGNYDVYLIRLEGDGTVPPQITLISPNGGETWTVGDTVESTWTVTGEIDSFDVRLSRDGGASYNELLSAGIPGDSTAWTWQGVSAPASDSCSISIIGYFGQFQTSDQSDGLFSIVPPLAPTLAVTYPDGGETWDVGDTVSITWEADAGFESFEILLSRTAGEPWDTLTSSLSGLAENWVWEGVTGPESDECLIKIIGNSGAFTVEDVSDSVFTILPELPSGPEVLWTNTFGGGADEEARSHTSVSSSGGYALTGSVESGGSDDVYLIETDSDGNLLNLNNIGGILDDGGYCISETEDGGYIVAGYTFSEGSGSADYYLVKVDSGLEEEWTNTFGGSLEDRAYGVVEIPGEGYALAGFRTTLDGRDVYLVRTDVSGNYLWHQSFGGIGMDDCRSLARTADGGFILAGSTENFMADSIDAYIIKTDEFGGEEWSILIGENGTDIACSIIQLENGDYAGTGSTTSAGAGGEDVFLFKISSGGVFEWSRTYGGNLNDAGNSLKQTTDQGFVISGYTESSGAGGSDAYVIKTDAEGNAEWTKTIGGSENEIGYSMGLVSNIGYTIAGYTESYGSGGKDAWLIRLGPETPDVTVTLEPVEPPIIVPASGGEFEFTIFITNNSSVVQTTDIWTQIILPSSAAIPLINVQDIDIPPMTLERLRTQSVPEFAPGGIYSYYAYVGDYPWIVNHSNSFNFEKLGSEDGRIGTPFDWLCSGETFAGEKSVYAQIPKSYALSLPYPNPFNPTAAISYDLPKAGNVSIIVYNVSGREVASLIDRWQYPGSHLLTFDAAGLSSGIYFVRMNSGDFCRSHKMILLK